MHYIVFRKELFLENDQFRKRFLFITEKHGTVPFLISDAKCSSIGNQTRMIITGAGPASDRESELPAVPKSMSRSSDICTVCTTFHFL